MIAEQIIEVRLIIRDLKNSINDTLELQKTRNDIMLKFGELYMKKLNKLMFNQQINSNKSEELISLISTYIDDVKTLEELEELKIDFVNELQLFFGEL